MKSLRLLIILLILGVSPSGAIAQTWFFGDHAEFSFPGSTSVGDNAIFGKEPSASVSDADGNVIMYTDSTKLWNGNHEQQNIGNLLLSDKSATQGVLIAPAGCNIRSESECNEYFIFTVDATENDFANGFNVVKASVTGTAPNTTITISEPTLLATNQLQQMIRVSEKLCGAPDGNGGYYVYAHGVGLYSGNTCVNTTSCEYEDAFFRVHITNNTCTAEDLLNTMDVQFIGTGHKDSNHPYPSGGYSFNGQGQMKISPDGTMLALTIPFLRGVELFQLDNGVLSNPIMLDPSSGAFSSSGPMIYGIEFSPSGEYLYVSSIYSATESIFQFDVTAGDVDDIVASKITLAEETNNVAYVYGQLQLGPDDKIYIAKPSTSFLDVINQPDVAGAGADYVANGQAISGVGYLGLPNFIRGAACARITDVAEVSNTFTFAAYPVPATNTLNLQWSQDESVENITLVNALGQTLLEVQPAKAENKITLDISQFSFGVYIVTAQSRGVVVTKRILID